MLRSKVTKGIDVGRLSNAVSRPGIDPRIWATYGVLTSEPYIETFEGEQDIVADVLLLPSMQDETARVGAMYAGNGFGFYCPLHEGDEVLVIAPSGDPDEGLVITQRLFSPAAVPPIEAVTNPEDVTLVVQDGKNLRLHVKGTGNVVIASEQGQVKLGEEAATRGVARLDDTTNGGVLSITAVGVTSPAPTSTITFTYVPPSGVPQVATLVLTAGVVAPTQATFNLAGKIDLASTKVVSS